MLQIFLCVSKNLLSKLFYGALGANLHHALSFSSSCALRSKTLEGNGEQRDKYLT